MRISNRAFILNYFAGPFLVWKHLNAIIPQGIILSGVKQSSWTEMLHKGLPRVNSWLTEYIDIWPNDITSNAK